MNPEQLLAHLRGLAAHGCRTKHPVVFYSLICSGPGSVNGLHLACGDCMNEVIWEYQTKVSKAQGRELSPEEDAEVRKQLGIK